MWLATNTTELSGVEGFFAGLVGVLTWFASNPIYIGGIILVGILFTFVTRFVQIRHFIRGWKVMFAPRRDDEGTSSYKAVALAIGGRVGTGNIAGVTAAILTGGPGAVFWMWVIAFIGMATGFVETTLGQLYKEKTNEKVYVGGPAYYIEKGLGKKWKPLAMFYAIIMIVSFGLFFLSLHVSNIYDSTFSAFNIESGSMVANIIIILMLVLVAVAAFGGMRVLLNITAVITPIMTLGYLILVGFIIVTNLDFVGKFFTIVFSYAFNPEAIGGATFGSIISTGAKRGIFSNEAGQGSGAIAGATSSVKHPVEQGIAQMNTVFIDTFIVCTLTAFVVLLAAYNSGLYTEAFTSADQVASFVAEKSSADVAVASFSSFGSVVGKMLAAFFFLFAFSSLLGNMSYGMQNVKYLLENKKDNIKRIGHYIYATLALTMVLITPIISQFSKNNPTFNIFDIADSLSSGLFYANVIAMVLLVKKVREVLMDYEFKLQSNEEMTFDRKKFAKDNHFSRT